MKSTTLVATIVLVTVFASPDARADHRGKITWTDAVQGFRRAELDRKPMMVFFTADW